ncbi:MAG TPA: hypothetical protein VH023_08200 [Rhodopila sp.]|jgi:hypothetical protein|nr:hypothetical protein [Rhodopila sp.]
MQRLRNTGMNLPPRPNGSLLAGAVIGTAIMTIALQAITLGIGAAISATAGAATPKDR